VKGSEEEEDETEGSSSQGNSIGRLGEEIFVGLFSFFVAYELAYLHN